MQERKLYVLDEPIPEEPAANAPKAQRDTYIKHQNDLVDVKCLLPPWNLSFISRWLI